VKELLIVILLAGLVGLYFDDKQQKTDLGKARDDNALLTHEVDTLQTQYNQLLTKTRQPGNWPDAGSGAAPSDFSGSRLQDSGSDPLNRPAY